MNPEHPLYHESLESLQAKAIEDINVCRKGLISWADKIRPQQGPRGRFNWAVEYNADMPANIGSTSYVLEALGRVGILDEVITEEDKKEGIAWVQSMGQPEGGYLDPVYMRDPEEPGDGVSDGGFKETIDRYAEVILQHYGVKATQIKQSPPPPGWPQLETAHTAANWIKMRTWEYDTWRAGAVSEKVVYFLYQWCLKDMISIEPLTAALREIYSFQDPKTGMWANRSKSNCTLQNRINGTFKLLHVISKELSLPLFHCEKMIDTVIDHMTSDYYEGTRSGCDELDNLFVLAVASGESDNYRFDEIQKLAAYSISLIKKQYYREDGGLSFYPDYCQHNWLGYEVAPIILQGDAMGASVHTFGLLAAVDLADLKGQVDWAADWRGGWRSSRVSDAERKLKELKEQLSDMLLK